MLACAVPACGRPPTEAALRAEARAPAALNARMVLRLDGAVDPLAITAASVAVRREDGRQLDARLGTVAGELVVELVVTPQLLADAPAAVFLELLGLPSPHALRTTDGRRLGRSELVRWPLTGRLQARAESAPYLLEVDGRRLPLDGPLATLGTLRLVFDGPLDPSTLRPESCPLFPLEHGLTLATPILPEVDWRCVGERFELLLDLGRPPGPLELNLRRFGVRDPLGRSPEPPLRAEVRAS